MTAEPVSHFISAPDGLRLHVREYAAAGATPAHFPVVCLPGLARTAADFDRLARVLSAGGHRVLALDYRGRGLSARDPDPAHYDIATESADVLATLAAAQVRRATFIGTSRGGLITMLLATLQPALMAGAVLNDIGPVIEAEGLARIKGYVGKLPQPSSWAEAVALLKQIAGAQFTALTDADWLDFAQLTFKEEHGVFALTYDPALMENLRAMRLDAIPTLWPQFEALRDVPVLVVRGANSDLLSVSTTAEMMGRHPDCALYTVPNQGHAPFLTDAPTIERIRDFVAHCEAVASA